MMNKEQQAQLRAPFSSEQIQKLDAGYAKLDYVSHAWVTNRLLEVDPMWTWEPAGFDANGLPAFDENGGLWIKLTVCGVTRYGYGEPQGRDKFDANKGAIGNALRNAAMRFGVALDLWAKEDTSKPVAKPAVKATTENSAVFLQLKAIIDISASHAELANVANTIQGANLTDKERDALRLLWTNKQKQVG
jgi:hypothetical protein